MFPLMNFYYQKRCISMKKKPPTEFERKTHKKTYTSHKHRNTKKKKTPKKLKELNIFRTYRILKKKSNKNKRVKVAWWLQTWLEGHPTSRLSRESITLSSPHKPSSISILNTASLGGRCVSGVPAPFKSLRRVQQYTSSTYPSTWN